MSDVGFDCTRCGACCIATCASEEHGYAALRGDEFSRWPQSKRAMLVREEDTHDGEPEYYVGTKTLNGKVVCIAFDGVVGESTSCTVYDHRPRVCAKFEPGNPACLYARSEAGVSRALPVVSRD